MKLRPLYNRIVAKRTKIDATSLGGIILTIEDKDTETEAVVLSIGHDVVDVNTGDRILFGRKIGTDVKVDGEDVVVLREEDVIAVLS